MAKQKRRKVIKDLDRHRSRGKAKEVQDELDGIGMYPLDAPGMPMPGPDFLENARRLGDKNKERTDKVTLPDGRRKTVKSIEPGEWLEVLHARALRDPNFNMSIQVKAGLRKQVNFVPGHIWGQHQKEYAQGIDLPVDGPRPADIMVIGKMPGQTEVQEKRNFVGESGALLLEVLRDLKIKGMGKWYITNLCKFHPPDGQSTLKSGWIKDCMPLLHQELRIVRPKYILCLGADASKELLGKKNNVHYMDGRVVELEYPINVDGEEVLHKSHVMTVVHPAAVARAPEQRRMLERGLSRFDMLTKGIRWDLEEKDIDHRAIRTLEELKSLLWEIENDPTKKDRVIAVDAEWHGEHPVNKGSYVRTVQFAWQEKRACAVVLRGPGGKVTFVDEDGKPAIKRGLRLLSKFFKNKRVVGHFFVADLEWLVDIGLDLVPSYRVPLRDKRVDQFSGRLKRRYEKLGFSDRDYVPAWLRTKYEGGADTGLMAHAIEETAMLGLEGLAMRYTTVPRYDIPLHEWREQFCKDRGLKSKDLEGYGECPDEILIPYGIYDADATLRLFYALNKLLDYDYEGNCCREPFWEAMIACPAILEMHQTGIPVHKPRIDYLTEVFMEARTEMEAKIRTWAKWSEFNVRSVQQVREFLFGEQLNGKVTKDGGTVRIRPKGAKSLYVEPLLDTGKPPTQWWQVKEKGLEGERSPSTNKAVLAILAQENEEASDQINWLRDYRFLDQVLKSLLRPPVTDDDGNWLMESDGDGLGGLLFDAGLASVVCNDGRVRTHLYPTTETGRWRSARPNLQNISKQRDADYVRMLGEKYKHKLRSILKAPPGYLLIEADYIGAELYGMATMSGDEVMIDHCQRNQLPEDDPNFYDIHSNVAVFAFKLDCPPTKAGLKAINKAHLRIVAKSVIFGIAYGRGAKAIALAAKEQGVEITADEAQQVIDTIFDMYPGLRPFFEECKSRAINDGWLCHCFGRFRRFPRTDDYKLQGEFERQATNFPIQGMIASAVDRAVAEIYEYRHEVGVPDMYKMVLQIHDAVVLLVPYEHAERVVDEVLPVCMQQRVPIYPTNLAGVPTGKGPYTLGIDTEVMVHWGEHVTKEQAAKWGVPSVTAGGTKLVA